MIPQLLITLSPTGTLQAELPGRNGHRTVIPLDDHQAAAQLRHLLKDQLLSHAAEAHIAHQQRRTHHTYDHEVERLIDLSHKAASARLRVRQQTKPTNIDPTLDLGI